MSSRSARRGAAILRAGAALLLCLAPPGPDAAGAAGEGAHRLKPGARGRACLACHPEIEEALKSPSVHTPVKAGTCSDCHDPHAADHAGLLAAVPERICLACHGNVAPDGSRSVHAVVREGTCVRCHDPHASGQPNLLLAAGNALCLGCHEDLAKALEASEFRHSPVSRGCSTCHVPHASAASPALLRKDVPALCVACHRTDEPAFAKAHRGYSVGRSDCGSCHDPHGSSVPGILRTSVHAPVAGGTCVRCHPEPGSADPLAPKREGIDLCRGCHVAVVNDAFSKNRIHWPLVDGRACRNCHRPHASAVPRLLARPPGDLCGGCHRDAVDRHARSATKHPPVGDGECLACHEPHASNEVHLLPGPEREVCGSCHDWTTHSAHPMGETTRDPRNRNLEVGCDSCHRAHGTPFRALGHFDPKMDLCVQCHEGFKR